MKFPIETFFNFKKTEPAEIYNEMRVYSLLITQAKTQT